MSSPRDQPAGFADQGPQPKGAKLSQEETAMESLIGGKYSTVASYKDVPQHAPDAVRVDSFENKAHIGMDYAFGGMALGFSSAMHVVGQSTAMHMLTMFAAGVTFFVNGQLRGYQGITPDIHFYEALAGWLWMLTSVQQFAAVKKMKYAGMCSWTSLPIATYYTARHIYSKITSS